MIRKSKLQRFILSFLDHKGKEQGDFVGPLGKVLSQAGLPSLASSTARTRTRSQSSPEEPIGTAHDCGRGV